ncbi:phage tail sheath C-terminal domain-containing protein [Cytobacillus purgationiresistens]|uniref:Phage tail sheath protein n=1 Tax=Cytobacillus purgationiresistens TaxID=863449 RepID=A0ABU0AFA0_9BACI|nr:phage tail sheath C-terminal domain-containing protein [Cytobacillus purgationiresistens]MDQ0269938.1 hypothetical protein [Cytobacillus purgationiresistens]
MAGGHWESQNKVRPGAYINFETNDLVATGVDARGAVAIPLALDWGATGVFTKVSPGSNLNQLFGRSLNELLPIREAFKATGEVIVYNLSGKGEKAKATSDTFSATAVHSGSDGNKITVTISLGLEGEATVKTHYDGVQVDLQEVSSSVDLTTNAYVTFSGELPEADETLTLSGGKTEKATNESYAAFAVGLDSQNFKVVAIGTEDESVKALFATKVKKWREDEGKNITLVTNNYNTADHEGIVSVKNYVVLDRNEIIEAKEAVYWYGAAYAIAGTSSLTYVEYPGAIDCERLSHEDIVKALKDGHIAFTFQQGMDGVDSVVIEQDINTFRSITAKKNQDFRKNKIIRTMDFVGNNVQHIYSRYFIGQVNNNEDGRNLFKGQIMTTVLDPLVQLGAIEAYNPDEFIIDQGMEKDAVTATLGLKFVDAMEKLYMTVECK